MTCKNPDNFMNTSRCFNLFNGIPFGQKSVKYQTVVKFIIHLFCSLPPFLSINTLFIVKGYLADPASL